MVCPEPPPRTSAHPRASKRVTNDVILKRVHTYGTQTYYMAYTSRVHRFQPNNVGSNVSMIHESLRACDSTHPRLADGQ